MAKANYYDLFITVLTPGVQTKINSALLAEDMSVEALCSDNDMVHHSPNFIAGIFAAKVGVDKLKDRSDKRTVNSTISLFRTEIREILNKSNISYLSLVVVIDTCQCAWSNGNIKSQSAIEKEKVEKEVNEAIC